MPTYKTPGVYIEEISLLPPNVAQVETAIPAFIGYTEKGPTEPTRIRSLVEFIDIFGGPALELPEFIVNSDGSIQMRDPSDNPVAVSIPATPVYRLFYFLQMYFANGGGPCYIVSVGNYTLPASADNISADDLRDGLAELRKEDEPTLILFPEAGNLVEDDGSEYDAGTLTTYHSLYVDALQQCADLQDRFVICDVYPAALSSNPITEAAGFFRNGIGTSNLKYGAAYYPDLLTSLTYSYSEEEIVVAYDGGDIHLRRSEEDIKAAVGDAAKQAIRDDSLFHQDNESYFSIRKMIDGVNLVLPSSGAIAGIYAFVDSTRGVWKAPANVSLNRVIRPVEPITSDDQEDLNETSSGKSINAIRTFTGKGVLVWGARTLAGNDTEWKYINVRRTYNMIEESVKKASEQFVFEPNDNNTWVKVRAMIENFLTLQWRNGALMGATPEQAYFVKVGLGETMTGQDVLNGRMIVEIGLAVVRPAEFIILRFSHKMIES